MISCATPHFRYNFLLNFFLFLFFPPRYDGRFTSKMKQELYEGDDDFLVDEEFGYAEKK